MPTLCMRHFIWDQTRNDEKMEIENWFKGFEKGLERLSSEQRSAFLLECGKNCVNGGTLSVYQKLHERAQGDMDTLICHHVSAMRAFTPKRDLFAAMSVERETIHSDALPFHLAWRNRLRNENRSEIGQE